MSVVQRTKIARVTHASLEQPPDDHLRGLDAAPPRDRADGRVREVRPALAGSEGGVRYDGNAPRGTPLAKGDVSLWFKERAV